MRAWAGWRQCVPWSDLLHEGTAEGRLDHLNFGLPLTALLPRRPEGNFSAQEDDVETRDEHVADRLLADDDLAPAPEPSDVGDGIGTPPQLVIGPQQELVRNDPVGEEVEPEHVGRGD